MIITRKCNGKWQYIINCNSKQFIKGGFDTKIAANEAAKLQLKLIR